MAFPNQESGVNCTEAFFKYLTEGTQADSFGGLEIKCRVMDTQNGTGNDVVNADGPQKIWEHALPWINGFSVKVEVREMLTDEKFVETAKNLPCLLNKKSKIRKQTYILGNKFYII